MPDTPSLQHLTDQYGGSLPDPRSIEVPTYFRDLFVHAATDIVSVVTDNFDFIFLGIAIVVAVGLGVRLFHVHRFGKGVAVEEGGQLRMKV
jgi:hypothetical protein